MTKGSPITIYRIVCPNQLNAWESAVRVHVVAPEVFFGAKPFVQMPFCQPKKYFFVKAARAKLRVMVKARACIRDISLYSYLNNVPNKVVLHYNRLKRVPGDKTLAYSEHS